MIFVFKHLNKKLYYSYKFKYLVFLFFLFITALFQLVGMLSIYPLISLLIKKNVGIPIIDDYLMSINFNDQNNLIYLFSFLFVLIFTIFLLSRSIANIIMMYFSRNTELIERERCFKHFLNSNYLNIVSADDNEIRAIFNKSISHYGELVYEYFNSILNIFFTLCLGLILLILDIQIIFSLITLFVTLLSFYLILRKSIQIYFEKQYKLSFNYTKVMNTVYLGYKELVLNKISNQYIKLFNSTFIKEFKIQIKLYLLNSGPKIFLELFLYIFIVIFLLLNKDKNFTDELPKFVLLGLATIRLLPASYSIFQSFTKIRYNQDSINIIKNFKKKFKNTNHKTNNKPIEFKKNIKVLINFSYDNKTSFNYDFLIKKNEKVLIEGKSGSGKTTFFNILSGLIKNKTTNVLVDGRNIYSNLESYWSKISYVSQHAFIFSGTLAYNISLKNKLDENDNKKLKEIYDLLNFQSFISYENFINKKYNIFGDKISGGQKQRICLARAIYKKPTILILDEALSGLEKKSEVLILSNIIKYVPNLTLIAASHRPVKKFFDKQIKLKS